MDELQTIIIDSDAVIALLNPVDANHTRAQVCFEKLSNKEVNLLFPASTVLEVLTTLKYRMKSPDLCKRFIKLIESGDLSILPIDEDIILLSLDYFDPNSSKSDTSFDATVAACAHKEKTPYIFSFDKWYKQQEFKLISEEL